ncbi:peptidoglycan DD-metalloendopeptidase family protein [Arthrobacter sp. H5]|uniref:M23 family metallopeptidase n=1 Tax=Arthrobacter sp. H5 TaxID=1267973 RepID=UPI0004B56748|nr:peptidoglycan DD-metalloendopeptidase family protein [Arthrobacter sp. H5]
MSQPAKTGRRRASGPASPVKPAGPRRRLHALLVAAGVVTAGAGVVLGGLSPLESVEESRVDAAASAPKVTAEPEAAMDFSRERLKATRSERAAGADAQTAKSLSSGVTKQEEAEEEQGLGAPLESLSIASPFGYRVNPLGGTGTELHTGTDYAGSCGTPVLASDSGTVVESGWHAYGGGQRIVVDHGEGIKTSYNHLGSLGVSVGQEIGRGDNVGAVGTTGNSTGCHLHFEVIVNDAPVDPQGHL